MRVMKNVALYARVSTNKHKCRACKRFFPQAGLAAALCPKCGSSNIELGQNPETQLDQLREYTRNRGLIVVAEYVDRGVSGATDSRPKLDVLMKDARAGKFDAVLVWKFDRFARSTRHLVTALEEFQALGIHFISLTEAIDTSTPMGRMVFTVLGAVAELERSLIVERVINGMAYAGKHGTKSGVSIGRPRVIVDRDAVRYDSTQGLSIRALVEKHGIGMGTVRRILARSV